MHLIWLLWLSLSWQVWRLTRFSYTVYTHYPTLTHSQLHMSKCLMGPPCSASLFSGCAQTEYTSWRAWNRARLVYWILGHKCGPCPRTAGPFKTGLSLIGHTSVAPSWLRARQLIREQNKAGLLQAGRLSTLHAVNRMESIFYFVKNALASPLLVTAEGQAAGNCVPK